MTAQTRRRIKKSIYGTSFGAFIICLVMMLAFYAFFKKSKAWFSQNKDVTANGMTVMVDSESSLVISGNILDVTNRDTPEGYQEEEAPISSGTLLPATRDTTDGVMKYLDFNSVDAATGNAISGKSLTAVPAANAADYYIDVVTYVGSAGKGMNFTSITAQLSSVSDGDSSLDDYLKSACIGIYTGDSMEYCGTLQVIDQTQTVTLIQGGTAVTSISRSTPLKVTFRLYFDGAMTDSNGKAYIRSDTVAADTLSLGITVKAIDAETAD